jgi:hypothetical protein
MKIFPELWGKGEWAETLHIIGDKGYDFSLVRKLIRSAGKHPVIPRREGAVCPGVKINNDTKPALLLSISSDDSRKIREWHCVLTSLTLHSFLSLRSLV